MTYLQDARVKWIVIHYSATPIECDTAMADIEVDHRRRGFREFGYHFYIRLGGQLEFGRDLSEPGRFEMGAHSKGENDASIGICFEGGVTLDQPNVGRDTRTPEQIATMIRLIRDLQERFPNAVVTGHRDMPGAATQCPGFNAGAWWQQVEREQANALPVLLRRLMALLARHFAGRAT